MNKKLIVDLLHKNIEELAMITASFQEQDAYSQAIIQLASRKTEDIQTLLAELAAFTAVDFQTTSGVADFELEIAQELVDEPIHSITEELVSNEPLLNNIHVDDLPDLTFAQIEPEIENDAIENDEIEIEETVDEKLQIADYFIIDKLEDSKKMTISEKLAMQGSRNETFAHSDNSLSATIANKKISDIKQAISIGDRFRFQRELFKSNGEDMNRTLTYLNLLATHDEALSFLKSKYAWDETSEAANDFYQLVKRKFI